MNKLKFLRWLFSACMHTKSFASFVWSNTRGSGTCSAKHTRHPHVGHQHVRQVKEIDQEEKSFTLNGHFLDSFIGQWRKKKIFSPSFLFLFLSVLFQSHSHHICVCGRYHVHVYSTAEDPWHEFRSTSNIFLPRLIVRCLIDLKMKMKIFTDFLKTSQKLNQHVSVFR